MPLQTTARHIILKCLAWRPIHGLPHHCPPNWQEPQLACVWRALANVYASSCCQDWSWGSCLLFLLKSHGTPIPDRHASLSISNSIHIALAVTFVSRVLTDLLIYVVFLSACSPVCGHVYLWLNAENHDAHCRPGTTKRWHQPAEM